MNERCEPYLKELNDLIDKNNVLVEKNKKLKELSSKLYDSLNSSKNKMMILQSSDGSELNGIIKDLEKDLIDNQILLKETKLLKNCLNLL